MRSDLIFFVCRKESKVAAVTPISLNKHSRRTLAPSSYSNWSRSPNSSSSDIDEANGAVVTPDETADGVLARRYGTADE